MYKLDKPRSSVDRRRYKLDTLEKKLTTRMIPKDARKRVLTSANGASWTRMIPTQKGALVSRGERWHRDKVMAARRPPLTVHRQRATPSTPRGRRRARASEIALPPNVFRAEAPNVFVIALAACEKLDTLRHATEHLRGGERMLTFKPRRWNFHVEKVRHRHPMQPRGQRSRSQLASVSPFAAKLEV